MIILLFLFLVLSPAMPAGIWRIFSYDDFWELYGKCLFPTWFVGLFCWAAMSGL